MSTNQESVGKCTIELANSVFWSAREQDKVYLNDVQIAIGNLPFSQRQVFWRFVGGPAFDFSLFDMDRLAIEYLKMRGVKLPKTVQRLTQAEPPPQCDFLVPSRLMQGLNSEASRQRNSIPKGSKAKKKCDRKRCGRCDKISKKDGDWFGTLCPKCADETDGLWTCCVCGQTGNFEAMGGCEANNPNCCESSCEQIRPEAE